MEEIEINKRTYVTDETPTVHEALNLGISGIAELCATGKHLVEGREVTIRHVPDEEIIEVERG